MTHEERYESAIEAASRLHGDYSVALETTLQSLNALREHIDYLIDAVETDIRKND